MRSDKGTLLALAAITLWSTLALVGVRSRELPPFLLLGVAFLTSGSLALFRRSAWKVSVRTIAVGVMGIFGYHALYFYAFSLAPAIEVNLINYLWPLLIVLLAPLILPQFQLRWNHIGGAILGLCGAALIATGGQFTLQAQSLGGYLAALGAALIWALYSLLTRRLPRFPTESVALFCLLSGLLALCVHFSLGYSSQTIRALTPQEWLMMLLVGAGPMGAAFYFWDAALKAGDPRRIGSLAYLTPLLSTLNLILFARQALTWVSALAMAFIISGAILGSRGSSRSTAEKPTAAVRK